MKIYLASRTRHTEKMKYVAEHLKKQGHEIFSDWIYIDEKLKPFVENIHRVQEIAKNNTEKMLESDMLLLFNDLTGTDIFTEMGVCLATKALKNPHMKLYVVGKYDQTSLMQLHPYITHFKNLEEVFLKENIETLGFVFPEID